MEILYIIVIVASAVQLGVYIMNKQKKKETGILKKYNVKSRGDLFKLINSHSIPPEDRALLEKHYQQNS